MNQLVVLCALFAAVAAKPGVLGPLGYSSFATTYPAAPVISTYSAPAVYSGAPLIGGLNTYSAYPAYSAYSGAHFIKKRSVALPYAAAAYVAPTTYAASPLLTTYSSPLINHAAPLYASAPVAYSHHYLKKRSAPLAFGSYLAPTSYSTQSRFDVHTSTPVITSYAAAPVAYSSPIAYSHYF